MAFSKRAEELRVSKDTVSEDIPCLAIRGGIITKDQCSSRNRSYQQNVQACVGCPRRLCPHCLTEGRLHAGLVSDCTDHTQTVAVSTSNKTRMLSGKFTPSEEALKEEQRRPVARAGCGNPNDHSLIDYHSLIER